VWNYKNRVQNAWPYQMLPSGGVGRNVEALIGCLLTLLLFDTFSVVVEFLY